MRTFSFCGTIEYMSPELIKGGQEGHGFGVDWWSVGVLTYELLTGASPFTVDGERNTQAEISKRILKNQPPIPEHLSHEARDFILSLLVKDPARRLGGCNSDAKQLKEHPFLAKINWNLLAQRKLRAPFRPRIKHELDVSNFADEFTSMAPHALAESLTNQITTNVTKKSPVKGNRESPNDVKLSASDKQTREEHDEDDDYYSSSSSDEEEEEDYCSIEESSQDELEQDDGLEFGCGGGTIYAAHRNVAISSEEYGAGGRDSSLDEAEISFLRNGSVINNNLHENTNLIIKKHSQYKNGAQLVPMINCQHKNLSNKNLLVSVNCNHRETAECYASNERQSLGEDSSAELENLRTKQQDDWAKFNHTGSVLVKPTLPLAPASSIQTHFGHIKSHNVHFSKLFKGYSYTNPKAIEWFRKQQEKLSKQSNKRPSATHQAIKRVKSSAKLSSLNSPPENACTASSKRLPQRQAAKAIPIDTSNLIFDDEQISEESFIGDHNKQLIQNQHCEPSRPGPPVAFTIGDGEDLGLAIRNAGNSSEPERLVVVKRKPSLELLYEKYANMLEDSHKKAAPNSRTKLGPTDFDLRCDFFKKYHLLNSKRDLLGKGAYSIVKRCVHKETGKEYAVKIMKRDCQVTRREIDMLRRCQGHPNIVRLFDVYQDQYNSYLVCELLSGGELLDRLNHNRKRNLKIAEAEVCRLFRCVVSSIYYLHSMNIVHRDLKLENLLFVDSSDHSELKLIDFGFAREIPDLDSGEEPMKSPCITYDYCAPEVLSRVLIKSPSTSSISNYVSGKTFFQPTQLNNSLDDAARISTTDSTRSSGSSLLLSINSHNMVPDGRNSEQLDGYDESCDLWSMGVILYTLLSGRLPFRDQKQSGSFSQLVGLNGPEWAEISQAAKDLVRGLLEPNPKRRLTIDQLTQNDWILNYDHVASNSVGRKNLPQSHTAPSQVEPMTTSTLSAVLSQSDELNSTSSSKGSITMTLRKRGALLSERNAAHSSQETSGQLRKKFKRSLDYSIVPKDGQHHAAPKNIYTLVSALDDESGPGYAGVGGSEIILTDRSVQQVRERSKRSHEQVIAESQPNFSGRYAPRSVSQNSEPDGCNDWLGPSSATNNGRYIQVNQPDKNNLRVTFKAYYYYYCC